MLQIIYILVFTALAILAIANLMRSLLTFAGESQRGPAMWSQPNRSPQAAPAPHPELLDDAGNMVKEPLMVMRSITMEDVRSQLDSLYNASPGGSSLDSSEEKER
ncbi:MAG: DUF2973 domain-containing protein [Cyanobacteria bacterium P01_H01_bin.121]